MKRRFVLVLAGVGLCINAQAQVPAPSGLTQVGPYNGQVNLIWTPNPAATSYQVSRALWDMTNTPTPSVVSDVPVTVFNVPSGTPVFTDFQVTDGRSYQYGVAGIDVSGTPGASAAVTALPYTIPSAINPSVANNHANSLDLSWSVPLSTFPVLFYNIYGQSSASAAVSTSIPAAVFFTSSPTPIATTFSTSYTDQQASSVNPNFYAVVAVDSQSTPATGAFPASSTNGALANNALAPAAPLLFGFIPVAGYGTATPGAPTATPTYGVQLFWNGPVAAEGVTNYQVYANQTEIATVVVSPTPLSTYSFPDSTSTPWVQLPGSLTSYSVVAVSTVGTATSNIVSENIVAPSVYGTVQVTPNATSNSVTITWSAGTPGTYGMITSYAVYRGQSGVPIPFATPIPGMTPAPTDTPAPFTVIVETPSRTPTVMAVDTIANSNGYTYWVQPFDSSGEGGNISTAATPQLNLAPTPVSTLLVNQVANTNNKINVTWGGASSGFYGPIANYAIYRFVMTPPAAGTPTLTPVVTVGFTRTSRNDYVDDFSGDTAFYAVGAVDSLGNVSTLNVFSNPEILNTAVIAPQVPHVLPSLQTATGLTFNWLLNPVSDNVTNYAVFGSDFYTVTATTSNTPSPIAMIQATATPFATGVPPLWSGSTYYLEAVNAQGYSQPATLSSMAMPTYQITVVVPTPTQVVNLSWNMTPFPNSTPYTDSWVIYRSSATPTPGGDSRLRPIATIPIASLSYVDSSALPGIQYSYFVTARSDLAGTPVAESPISVAGSGEATLLTWPNIPAGLSSNTGSNATTLFWTPNPTTDAVQSYTFFHNGVPATPTMTAVFAETPGTISSYQVFANNSNGSSNSSVTLSVLAAPSMTPTVVLTPPADYTPVSSPTPMVWISGFAYPPGVQSYNVYRSTSSNFLTQQLIGTVSSPTPFISDPGQPGYINYYKAVANSGTGVTANFTLSGLVGIDLWPNPPGSFLASAGPSAVTISWSAPVSGNSPVTAYAIYKGIASGAENPTATVVSSLNSSTDSQVTPGVPYYYYINSISGGLNSAPTSEEAVIPSQAPILNASAAPGQALLTWSPVTVATTSPLTEYVISKLTLPMTVSSTQTPTFITTNNLTMSSYNDSAVTYFNNYVYKVAPVAIATTGVTIYGSYSNSVTVNLVAQAPASVSAVSGDQLVQLRWNYPGITTNYTYTIQRKLGTAPVSAYQTIATGVTGLDYTDTGLLDKTLYNYQIISVDATNTAFTGTSQPVNALPAKPPVVDNPTLTLAQTQNGNTINWTAANSNPSDFNSATMYPLGGYHVYRSSDGGGTYELLDAQGDTLTSYTDQVSIINGTSYTYLVRAFDAPPNVNTSDPNMVHESVYSPVTAAGLNASTALDRNSLRPFGASNEQMVHIRFVVTAPGNVQIKVYSLSGTFIKQLVNQYFGVGVYGIGGNYPLDWDGRNTAGDLVASGVYLITTEMNGLQEIDKIAVIK